MAIDFKAIEEMENVLYGLKNYKERAAMLQYFLSLIKNPKSRIAQSAIPTIKGFCVAEVNNTITELLRETCPKQKDEVLLYAFCIFELLAIATNHGEGLNQEEIKLAMALQEIIEKETAFENSVLEVLNLEKVDKENAKAILDKAKKFTNEFERGRIYSIILRSTSEIERFSVDAKKEFSRFFVDEFNKYLKKQDSLDEDEINNLELMVDVCKHFLDEGLLAVLEKVAYLPFNNIRFYALETMLFAGKQPLKGVVEGLEEDLEYAEVTYGVLLKYKRDELFSAEKTNDVYLATSNMVRWLVYPTELGKKPCDIKILGVVDIRGSTYFVFKYKSDSNTLADELKNVWLVGWANFEGKTFSHFDALSQFEKKTTDKTLKAIKKSIEI